MPKKRHKPEEIVAKLRQVDVLTSQGATVSDAIRQIWRDNLDGNGASIRMRSDGQMI